MDQAPASVTVRDVHLGGFRTIVRSVGRRSGQAVVFLHGMFASAVMYERVMKTVAEGGYYALGVDLRGYGENECPEYDATKGLKPFAEDVDELLEQEGLPSAHLVGWSLGGGIALQFAILHPSKVLSLTLEAPLPPYGKGATKDSRGTPCWPDFAGSGPGGIPPEMIATFLMRDTSPGNPYSLPNLWNNGLFKEGFVLPVEVEARYFGEAFKTKMTQGLYPGDLIPSPNWPGYRPGLLGIPNALSPAYCNLSSFSSLSPQPPVLWLRGDSDVLISDEPRGCPGFLGQMGVIMNWPGREVFPPQPMVRQTREVFEEYKRHGGRYTEVILPDCGHAPHIECESLFNSALLDFLRSVAQA